MEKGVFVAAFFAVRLCFVYPEADVWVYAELL